MYDIPQPKQKPVLCMVLFIFFSDISEQKQILFIKLLAYVFPIRKKKQSWVVMAHALISAPGRQMQVNFCESKVSLVYIESSKKSRATQRNSASNKQTNKQKETND